MPVMTETARTYKQKEVAELFGYSANYYSRMVKENRAPVMPIPGSKKYSRAEVDSLLAGKPVVKDYGFEATKHLLPPAMRAQLEEMLANGEADYGPRPNPATS